MDGSFIAIIAVVVAILLLVLAIRSGKLVFKILLGIAFLVFLVVLIYALVIFSNNLDVKTEFEKTSTLFMVVDDNTVVSALYLKSLDDVQGFTINQDGVHKYDKFFEKIPVSAYAGLSRSYRNDDLEELLSTLNLERILIIHTDAFFEVSGNLFSIEGIPITVNDAGLAMESDDPVGYLSMLVAEKKEVPESNIRPLVSNSLGNNAKTTMHILFMAKMVSGDFKSFGSYLPIFRLQNFEAYPNSAFFSSLHSGSDLLESLMYEEGDVDVDTQ